MLFASTTRSSSVRPGAGPRDRAMSGLLLDTDTCVELLRGNACVVAQAREHSPAELAASVLTGYELLYGVERCQPERREQERGKSRASARDHFLS